MVMEPLEIKIWLDVNLTYLYIPFILEHLKNIKRYLE